jgi:integrase
MGVVVPLPDRASRGRTKTDRVAFTEKRLKELGKPASGARYIFDKKEPGLCVRLTPTSAQFVFYKWHNGQPGRITIAKLGEIELPKARQIAAGYRGDLARGIDVFAQKAKAKPLTLADAFQAHIARPDMRLSTRRDYTSLWDVWVSARLKNRPLADIDTTELKRLHSKIGEQHPRTANKMLALLSALLTQHGRRHDNPVQGISRFREEPRQRVLTIDELRRLRTALEAEREPWRSFFMLALLTGARRGALQRMRWADLDLEAAIWRIPAEWSKNRKVLTVALATEAVAVLRALHDIRGASPWVFPTNSKDGHLTEPKKAWRRVLKRAGIEGAIIHDLRRTLGTAVAADGGNAAIIQAVLGHMSAQSASVPALDFGRNGTETRTDFDDGSGSANWLKQDVCAGSH